MRIASPSTLDPCHVCSEPDEGGETAFPNSDWVDPKLKDKYDANFSECAKVGVHSVQSWDSIIRP